MCRKMKSGDGPQLSQTTRLLCSQRCLCAATVFPSSSNVSIATYLHRENSQLSYVAVQTQAELQRGRGRWPLACLAGRALPAVYGNATRLSSPNRSWTLPSCRSIRNPRCCGLPDVLITTTCGLDCDIHGSTDCLRTCDGPVRNVSRALWFA